MQLDMLFVIHWKNLKTEVSLWKRIKCFPSTIPSPEELESATITSYFKLVIEDNLGRENHIKMCFVHTKKRAFQIPPGWYEERL